MFKKALIAGAALASTMGGNAFALPSTADLKVIGTITPNACTVSLGGGASYVVDYGIRTVNQVETTYTNAGNTWKAEDKPVALAITCDSPMTLAMSLKDQKASTVFATDDGDTAYGFGLDEDTAGSAIGQFRVDFSGMKVSANSSAPTAAADKYFTRLRGSTPWTAAALGSEQKYFNPKNEISFAVGTAALNPTAVQKVTGDLMVAAYVSKALVASLTGDVKLNGLATLSVDYK